MDRMISMLMRIVVRRMMRRFARSNRPEDKTRRAAMRVNRRL